MSADTASRVPTVTRSRAKIKSKLKEQLQTNRHRLKHKPTFHLVSFRYEKAFFAYFLTLRSGH